MLLHIKGEDTVRANLSPCFRETASSWWLNTLSQDEKDAMIQLRSGLKRTLTRFQDRFKVQKDKLKDRDKDRRLERAKEGQQQPYYPYRSFTYNTLASSAALRYPNYGFQRQAYQQLQGVQPATIVQPFPSPDVQPPVPTARQPLITQVPKNVLLAPKQPLMITAGTDRSETKSKDEVDVEFVAVAYHTDAGKRSLCRNCHESFDSNNLLHRHLKVDHCRKPRPQANAFPPFCSRPPNSTTSKSLSPQHLYP